jgi:phosphatidylserine/phosphatidylglycerophosphate/cardiolipin synthase-like enzyme
MISELFYKASEDDEFIGLYNPLDSAVDISNWRIIDGNHSYSGSVIFPENAAVPPKGQLYIANNAMIFRTVMGFFPDFEYGNSSPAISDMISREKPGFALGRDEVLLLDSFGNLIDIVVYGDSEYSGSGWNGSPVLDAKKGEVLKRNFNEESQNFADANTSLDWKHMRHFMLGQSDFEYATYEYSGNMTLFLSPDSSYETIINEIEGAQSSIYLSLYEFTNVNLSQKIVEKLNEGIHVTILMEGGPVEGIQEHEKYILQSLFESGADIHFLVANATLSSRYRYIHAKYAVIDNTSVIISSENWKYTGIPVNNTYGNRGWGVVVRDSFVAGYFADVFLSDLNSVSYDIFPFTQDHPIYGNASSEFGLNEWVESGNYDPIFSSQTLEGDFKVSPVLSPDTSLLENDAVLGLINSAEDSLYIEQLDVRLNWDDGDIKYDNSYLNAAIEAAEERHVDVRILLASRYAFSDDPDLDNYDTYIYINDYAKNHNITDHLEARLADCDRLDLSKIHNKGMVVDGNKTLISSINWNRNSVTQNREVGVIIENEEVADYFTRVFLWDWNEPPEADCGEDISVMASETVQFSDLSLDSDYNIVGYFWDFDDGTNSTEQNPIHTFKEEGMYDVVLTITDGQYNDSYTITVIVQSPEEDAESSLGAIIYIALMVIFVIIIIIIVIFIRRMRELFI